MTTAMKAHLMGKKGVPNAKKAGTPGVKKTSTKGRITANIKTTKTDAGDLRNAEIQRVEKETPVQTLTRHYQNRVVNTFRVWALSKMTHGSDISFSKIFTFAASHQIYKGKVQGKDFNTTMTNVWEGNCDAAHTFGFGLEEKRDVAVADKYHDLDLIKAVARVDLIPSNINSQGGLDIKFDENQWEFMKANYDNTVLRNGEIFFRDKVGQKMAVYNDYEVNLKKLVAVTGTHYTNKGNQPNILAVACLDAVVKDFNNLRQEADQEIKLLYQE